jgi:hypothetical protein
VGEDLEREGSDRMPRKKGRRKPKIPTKRFYVTMTDKTLSGWGSAKGKISKIVVPTDSHKNAKDIQKRFKTRTDMKNVNIRSSKPSYQKRSYHVAVKRPSQMSYRPKRKRKR